MGRLAALIQAGDANQSDFGRNPQWARVLAEVAEDETMVEGCCDYSLDNSTLCATASVYKSGGGVRHFSHLHPAAALRWARLGEKLLPDFTNASRRFESVCFSNLRQYKRGQIVPNGLFKIQPYLFNDGQKALLEERPWLGVFDIKDFFPSISVRAIIKTLPKYVSSVSLIDQVAEFVGELGVGLPQGYATSQIVAQLVLHYVDEQMIRWGIPYIRWVDDGRISGVGSIDVGSGIAAFNEFIDELGLNIHPAKTRCHRPSRAKCVPLLGGCPKDVNIEDYLRVESFEGIEPDAENFPYHVPSEVSQRRSANPTPSRQIFDTVALFVDHIQLSGSVRSEAIERLVVRDLAQREQEDFRCAEYRLASNRVGMEKLYARQVRPETAFKVGCESLQKAISRAPEVQHRGFTFLKEAVNCPDIRSEAIKTLTGAYEEGVPPHLEIEFCSVIERHQHTYASIVPIFRNGLENCWPDVAVARLAALSNLEEKVQRNHYLDIARKVRPATAIASHLIRAV